MNAFTFEKSAMDLNFMINRTSVKLDTPFSTKHPKEVGVKGDLNIVLVNIFFKEIKSVTLSRR